jgi:hypothetical protein
MCDAWWIELTAKSTNEAIAAKPLQVHQHKTNVSSLLA